MRRILFALGLSASLALGGCQNPNGTTNWGNTLLLGAGVGAAAALVAGAASEGGGYRRHGYQPARYSDGYGRGRSRWN